MTNAPIRRFIGALGPAQALDRARAGDIVKVICSATSLSDSGELRVLFVNGVDESNNPLPAVYDFLTNSWTFFGTLAIPSIQGKLFWNSESGASCAVRGRKFYLVSGMTKKYGDAKTNLDSLSFAICGIDISSTNPSQWKLFATPKHYRNFPHSVVPFVDSASFYAARWAIGDVFVMFTTDWAWTGGDWKTFLTEQGQFAIGSRACVDYILQEDWSRASVGGGLVTFHAGSRQAIVFHEHSDMMYYFLVGQDNTTPINLNRVKTHQAIVLDKTRLAGSVAFLAAFNHTPNSYIRLTAFDKVSLIITPNFQYVDVPVSGSPSFPEPPLLAGVLPGPDATAVTMYRDSVHGLLLRRLRVLSPVSLSKSEIVCDHLTLPAGHDARCSVTIHSEDDARAGTQSDGHLDLRIMAGESIVEAIFDSVGSFHFNISSKFSGVVTLRAFWAEQPFVNCPSNIKFVDGSVSVDKSTVHCPDQVQAGDWWNCTVQLRDFNGVATGSLSDLNWFSWNTTLFHEARGSFHGIGQHRLFQFDFRSLIAHTLSLQMHYRNQSFPIPPVITVQPGPIDTTQSFFSPPLHTITPFTLGEAPHSFEVSARDTFGNPIARDCSIESRIQLFLIPLRDFPNARAKKFAFLPPPQASAKFLTCTQTLQLVWQPIEVGSFCFALLYNKSAMFGEGKQALTPSSEPICLPLDVHAKPCGASEVSSTIGTGCVCEKGFTRQNKVCVPCGENEWKAGVGDMPCNQCPPNTNVAPTNIPATTAASCQCKIGHFNTTRLQKATTTSRLVCLDTQLSIDSRSDLLSSSPCLACPSCASCSGIQPAPIPGYWCNSPAQMYQCVNPSACIGQVFGDASCAIGYHGPLCGVCMSGFSAVGSSCVRCQHTGAAVGLFLLELSAMAVLVGYLIFTSGNQSRSRLSLLLKTFVNYMQMFWICSTFSVDWSHGLRRVGQSLGVISSGGSIGTSFSSQCLFGNLSLFDRLLVLLLSVCIAASTCFFLWWRCQLQEKGEEEEEEEEEYYVALDDHHDTAMITTPTASSEEEQKPPHFFSKSVLLRAFFVFIFAIYPTLLHDSLSSIAPCIKISDTVYVPDDFSLECAGAAYYFFQVVAWLIVIVLVGIIPGGLLYTLWWKQQQSSRSVLSFFISGYRPDISWWEVVVLGRKIVLLMIAVILHRHGMLQAVLAFLVLNISLLLQTNIVPFETAFGNRVETASLCALLVFVFVSMFYEPSMNPSHRLSDVTMTLFVIQITVAIMALAAFTREIVKRIQS